MIVSKDTTILECNNATVEILGCKTKADIIGQHLKDFNPPFQPRPSSTAVRIIRPQSVTGSHEDPVWVFIVCCCVVTDTVACLI